MKTDANFDLTGLTRVVYLKTFMLKTATKAGGVLVNE